jgi:hypothetical protein
LNELWKFYDRGRLNQSKEKIGNIGTGGLVRIAIHQPNFLPWLGYFNKIVSCDVFVFLDDVEIVKTGGTWTNRSKIMSNGEPRWLTLPIKRLSGISLIRDAEIADVRWKQKCISQIDFAYRSSPYHKQIMELVYDVFKSSTLNLSEFNRESLFKIISFLQLDPPRFVNSSDYALGSKSTDRLIDLVKRVGGNEYLSGDGSTSYLEPEKFEKETITLSYQNFQTKQYGQLNKSYFVPGLSIIDALMMMGPIKTLDLISTD